MINKINIDSVSIQIDSIVSEIRQTLSSNSGLKINIQSPVNDNLKNSSISIESLLRQEKI